MSMAEVTIYGNLGKDPELRYTPQGKAVANFSMATNKKGYGDQSDVTTWFKVTLWGKQAENASKYLAKGDGAIVIGELSLEPWTDRDGNERTTLEVNARQIQFVGGGKSDSNIEALKQVEPDDGAIAAGADDGSGIPF